jgi:hypothetical protein
MPSRPANISLIHRRCPGPSAAPGREQTHQREPDPLTLCSISEAYEHGGYETRLGSNRLDPHAGETMLSAALSLLAELGIGAQDAAP